MSAPTCDIRFEVAGPAHDPGLRQVLRENPMEGRVTLTLEREPHFFWGAALEGEVHSTMAVVEPAGSVVGMFSRSERPMWVGGVRRRMGYLSQLRLAPGYRGRLGLLRAGFERCRELHRSGNVPCYLTSIFEGNEPARRVLTAGLEGLPTYRECGRIGSYLWRARRRVRAGGGLIVERGTVERLDEIAALLARAQQELDFAPCFRAEDLHRSDLCRGLLAEDFFLARRGDRLVGCLALWDQRAFKQTVVRGYRGWLGPVAKLSGGLGRFLQLPAVGQAVPQAYLSHVAVADEDADAFDRLLRAAENEALRRGLRFLTTGLDPTRPIARVLEARRAQVVYSRLYLVHWDDGAGEAHELRSRRVHPEIAVM